MSAYDRSCVVASPGLARGSTGFSLIELMIAVTVLGIIMAVAYPNYQDYMFDSRRTDGQTALLEAAQRLERCYSNEMSYAAGDCGTLTANIDGSTSPKNFYALAASSTTTGYALQAAPQNAQAGDECGTLTLDQSGTEGITGAEDGVTQDDCW